MTSSPKPTIITASEATYLCRLSYIKQVPNLPNSKQISAFSWSSCVWLFDDAVNVSIRSYCSYHTRKIWQTMLALRTAMATRDRLEHDLSLMAVQGKRQYDYAPSSWNLFTDSISSMDVRV